MVLDVVHTKHLKLSPEMLSNKMFTPRSSLILTGGRKNLVLNRNITSYKTKYPFLGEW